MVKSPHVKNHELPTLHFEARKNWFLTNNMETNTLSPAQVKIQSKDQELAEAREQLALLLKEKEKLEDEIVNERKEKIKEIPSLLGVADMTAVLELLREVSFNKPSRGISRHRLTKQENKELKVALLNGMDNETAARKFGIGESTVYVKRRSFKIATRSRKNKNRGPKKGSSRRLTQNEKVAIKALRAKGTSVANIATDFKVSRATVYNTLK